MRLIFSLLLLSLVACNNVADDNEQIVGKWFNDQHWFEFETGNKYSGGVGPIANVTKQNFVLETEEKKITFHTANADESYYLKYEFIGKDTLVLTNLMSANSRPTTYYKEENESN